MTCPHGEHRVKECRTCLREYQRGWRRRRGPGLHAVATLRDADVLEWVASGLVDKEIAARLGISFRTVRAHLDRYGDPACPRGRAALVVRWLLSGDCAPERLARIRLRLGVIARSGVA